MPTPVDLSVTVTIGADMPVLLIVSIVSALGIHLRRKGRKHRRRRER